MPQRGLVRALPEPSRARWADEPEQLVEPSLNSSRGFVALTPPGVTITGVWNVSPNVSANTAFPQLFAVRRPGVMTDLRVEQFTASVGGFFSLWIYTCDANSWWPHRLVFDSQPISTTSTGVKAVTPNVRLSRGRYVAFIATNATVQFRMTTGTSLPWVGSAFGGGANVLDAPLAVSYTYTSAAPTIGIPLRYSMETGRTGGPPVAMVARFSWPESD